jgi:hypothetical protein
MNKISRSNRTKNVVSLQLARERARQPRGNSTGRVSKRGPLSNQRLLKRLEAENAQLRASVVELVLQIQALRDGATAFGMRRDSTTAWGPSSRVSQLEVPLAPYEKILD